MDYFKIITCYKIHEILILLHDTFISLTKYFSQITNGGKL